MKGIINMSRRDFLKTGALAGSCLILGVSIPSGESAGAAEGHHGPFVPNAFIRISTDGTVTIVVNKSEMGQGVYTSLPMLVAEELEVDWSRVRVEPAPVDPAYNHTEWGNIMGTGGSTSIRSTWQQLTRAGAAARIMLIQAAADTWNVENSACRAERGFAIHEATGRRLSYGQLVEKAAGMKPPQEVLLKASSDYAVIGKEFKRLDTPTKVSGAAVFGIDVTLPGLLVAVVARPPVFGGKMKAFEAGKAKAVPGVRAVVPTETGVAVVADSYWQALQGRDALDLTWDDGPLASLSTGAQQQQYAALARQPGVVAAERGDVKTALEKADRKLDALYEAPYLAHAPMEPLNCVVHVRDDGCEIWTGTQLQTLDRDAAAKIAGLPREKVVLHTTLLGGGFGRRAVPDSHFVREAVQISMAVKAPVKVIWTREDDIRGGYYRPRVLSTVSAGLDDKRLPIAWQQHIVSQSIVKGTAFAGLMKGDLDLTQVEGAADLPYRVPNLFVAYNLAPAGVPVLWWRSVGHSVTAFIVEGFIDELAHAAGRDPLTYRRDLLEAHPRHRALLDLVGEKAGWGRPLQKGVGQGIAIHESFGSIVAQVAEVSAGSDGEVRVRKVVCGIDCGRIVNPAIIRAQMESGIVFGLSAVFHGAITFDGGKVQQSNFHDYPILRIDEMPEVEVHIMPSRENPGGVGEPGVPPIAPAVANAIFAATGKRLRKLPIRKEDVRES